MMTNKELYKQAFGALHFPDTASRKSNECKQEKHFRPSRRLALVCTCVLLIIGLTTTVWAYGDQVLEHIFGWGNNMEFTTGLNEDGNTFSWVVVHTEDLTDPVRLEEGRMIFLVNGEELDITDQVSQTKSFRYEYTDEAGNTHLWLVGLNSEELANYGYAEYIKDMSGTWTCGYSARVNIEEDGTASAQWLEIAKGELDIPW